MHNYWSIGLTRLGSTDAGPTANGQLLPAGRNTNWAPELHCRSADSLPAANEATLVFIPIHSTRTTQLKKNKQNKQQKLAVLPSLAIQSMEDYEQVATDLQSRRWTWRLPERNDAVGWGEEARQTKRNRIHQRITWISMQSMEITKEKKHQSAFFHFPSIAPARNRL